MSIAIPVPSKPVKTTPGPGPTPGYEGVPAAIAGRTTLVPLNSATWTALPAIGLADRVSLLVVNLGPETVNLNYQTPVANEGKPLTSGAWAGYDITEAITVYARSTAGTPTVVVEELS